jgi:hypothetical protein
MWICSGDSPRLDKRGPLYSLEQVLSDLETGLYNTVLCQKNGIDFEKTHKNFSNLYL